MADEQHGRSGTVRRDDPGVRRQTLRPDRREQQHADGGEPECGQQHPPAADEPRAEPAHRRGASSIAPPAPPATTPSTAGKTNACHTTPSNRTVPETNVPPVASCTADEPADHPDRQRVDGSDQRTRQHVGANGRCRYRRARGPPGPEQHPDDERRPREERDGEMRLEPGRARHDDPHAMERELVEPSELERGRQRQPAAEDLDRQRRICATAAVATNASSPPRTAMASAALRPVPSSPTCASGGAGGAPAFTPRPPGPAPPPATACGRRGRRPPRAPPLSQPPCPSNR